MKAARTAISDRAIEPSVASSLIAVRAAFIQTKIDRFHGRSVLQQDAERKGGGPRDHYPSKATIMENFQTNPEKDHARCPQCQQVTSLLRVSRENDL
jgi:hypothetical protein